MKKYKLTITHLYPDHMNIYGDMGNIITLKRRCEWRSIDVQISKISLGDRLPSTTDIYFMGGGQDDDQLKVFEDLKKKSDTLIKHIDKGVCFLGICGAYQLLGKKFITGDGTSIDGIGLLNLVTQAPGNDVKIRCIGNIVAKLNNEVFNTEKFISDRVVGFENHSGQTILSENLRPLGYVLKGYGNNLIDKTEGVVYKNLIGTYMHGSFLPKNPHIADWLIKKALNNKYKKAKLKRLDDKEEWEAHQGILKMMNLE
jgi:CobQ-like glutamine amidotransferase family enzyme